MATLEERYPALMGEWHPRNTIMPSDVTFASAKKVWWKCERGHEWEAMVFSRTKNGSGCPYCTGKKADASRNLKVLFPLAAAEWHANNVGKPEDIPPHSGKKYWWMCNKGHEWEASVIHRTKDGCGCPYCCGQKTSEENCLAVTHPILSLEWDARNKLTPYDVTAGSHKSVYWKCPKAEDHVWKATIFNRVVHNSGCSCCAGRTVVMSNCLATTHPSVAIEWHDTNELTPYQVTYASNKMAWFQCSVNTDHVWRARIASRTTAGRGCPFCSSSKGEQAVNKVLESCGVKFEPQYKFDDCKDKRRLPFDFAVMDRGKAIGLIEFHGRQHYEEVAYFGGCDGHKGVVARDKVKKAYCERKFLPLLVIPYWRLEKADRLVKRFLSTLPYRTQLQ